MGSYITKIGDTDWDILQIADPKVIQGKIDAIAWEKAPQVTTDEKVTLGQLSICEGSIAGTNSDAINLLTFSVKADIMSDLFLVEEAKAALNDLELGHTTKKIPSLANAGVKYASIAMVDVGARAVHSGLHTLRVVTCTQGHQADVLAKYANTIPLSNCNQSLFGEASKPWVPRPLPLLEIMRPWKTSCRLDCTASNPSGVRIASREILMVPHCLFMARNANPPRASTIGPLQREETRPSSCPEDEPEVFQGAKVLC